MEDSQKKTELQKRLFDEIARKIPPFHTLVDVVSELLDVSTDAAYRRIRGDKTLNINECAVLCGKFGVSMDAVVGSPAGNRDFLYTPLDLRSPGDYLRYMLAIAERLERLAAAGHGAEIVLSAVDVPFFHFIPHKELTFFKLFAWTNSVYGTTESFETFARAMETPALLDVYRRIAAAHRRIPSREVWTESTIDVFLKLLKYNAELGHFADRATASLLCEQFRELMASLGRQAERGNKDETGEIPFRLYLSDVDLENNFILLRGGEGVGSGASARASAGTSVGTSAMVGANANTSTGTTGCLVKLFTINSLYVTDPRFCAETGRWLDQLTRRSTLISAASERHRHRFFANQREKIELLMESLNKP